MFRYVLYLITLVFAAWTAGTSLTQVQSHQRGVIRRFGRILDHKPGQGLHIGWPWGIDRVDIVPVGRVRSITVGFVDREEKDDDVVPAGQMLTGDHNLVNTQASINFKVRDHESDMENFVLHQHAVDAFVARAAESLLAEWIAGRKVDDVLRLGKSELPRFLHEHLQDRLDPYGLGVEIEHASIIRLDPPDQVKKEFDRLAEAQTTIRTKVNQAEQEAGRRKDVASSEIKAIDRGAKSYAREQAIESVAEAENFLKRWKQYRELALGNPDYLNTLWLDDMTRLYTRMKDAGRIELLDHFLTSEGLTITQFPLQPRKK
jgi:regulator of protease activity HflC (stomatin/prohibitin superfamily)